MARRPQYRDEDILESAREVFLARGWRATTAEVAEKAGVSEGTLFHHFKTKDRLFRAALNLELGDPPEVTALLARVGKGSVVENLQSFAIALVESMRLRLPFLMLAWSGAEPDQRHEMVRELEPVYGHLLRAVAAYVEGETRKGRLRRVDPEIAARALVGGLFDYVRAELVEARPEGLPLPAAIYVRGLIDLFIHGAAAPSTARQRARH